jgi:hypothetical protein
MGAQRVVNHQLIGDPLSQRRIEPAGDIDSREFGVLSLVVYRKLRVFTFEVGMFGVGLGVHGYVFTGSHGHRPSHQAGDAGDEYVGVGGVRGCHTEQQTRCGKDAVIRAQYRGAKPPNASDAVRFLERNRCGHA